MTARKELSKRVEAGRKPPLVRTKPALQEKSAGKKPKPGKAVAPAVPVRSSLSEKAKKNSKPLLKTKTSPAAKKMARKVQDGKGVSSKTKITAKSDRRETKSTTSVRVALDKAKAAKIKAAPAIKPTSKSKATQVKAKSNAKAQTSGKSAKTAKRPEPKKPDNKKKSASKLGAKPILEFPTTKWGNDSVISFEATEHMPPPELTSIAGGFVFYQDRLILANIPGRGWEIIGGRIDLNESSEHTFRREALNQAGVQLAYTQMIGIVRIEHMGPEPPNCPYPFPVSYGVQYIGIATELPKFTGSNDSLGRSLITPEGFREHYYEWNEYYDAVFRYAYEVYQKAKKKLKL